MCMQVASMVLLLLDDSMATKVIEQHLTHTALLGVAREGLPAAVQRHSTELLKQFLCAPKALEIAALSAVVHPLTEAKVR